MLHGKFRFVLGWLWVEVIPTLPRGAAPCPSTEVCSSHSSACRLGTSPPGNRGASVLIQGKNECSGDQLLFGLRRSFKEGQRANTHLSTNSPFYTELKERQCLWPKPRGCAMKTHLQLYNKVMAIKVHILISFSLFAQILSKSKQGERTAVPTLVYFA